MLTYWIRPAAAALFWMILTGSTLAELGTVAASLHAADRGGGYFSPAALVRDAKASSVRAE